MKDWRTGITGLVLIVLLLTGLTRYERTLFFPDRPAEAYPTLPLRNFHRLLVIAPHCDDEVLGAGGLIRAALRRGMDVRVVIVTAGDGYIRATISYFHHPIPRHQDFLEMGKIRQEESLTALSRLGLDPKRVFFLTYPERRLPILWWQRWDQPDRSPFTGQEASPYPRAYHLGTPYQGKALLEDLLDILGSFRPDLVVLPHPNDEHIDHRALSAFAQLAVAVEQERSPDYAPLTLGYLVHYGAYPQPSGLRPQEDLLPPRALDSVGQWFLWPLSADDVEAKMQALNAYSSQLRVLSSFLYSFVRQNELFMAINLESLRPLEVRILHERTGASLPQANEIVQPDPAGDRLVRQVAGGADIVALHIIRANHSLRVEVETYHRPSEIYQYSLQVLAIGPDLEALPRRYTVRPRKGNIVWPQPNLVQFQIDLKNLNAPLWIALSAETREKALLVDQTGWYILPLHK